MKKSYHGCSILGRRFSWLTRCRMLSLYFNVFLTAYTTTSYTLYASQVRRDICLAILPLRLRGAVRSMASTVGGWVSCQRNNRALCLNTARPSRQTRRYLISKANNICKGLRKKPFIGILD